MVQNPIREACEALYSHWGAQHWWPAQTRLEMMIGAILTQNTAWTNVEKAIENLRHNDLLELPTLLAVSTDELAALIRPAGYFNQKSRYIKTMAELIDLHFGGSLDRLLSLDTGALRKELLSWKGVGPETADSILLYAAKRPVFVVDAYTRRFMERHGWCNPGDSYGHIASLFTSALPSDVELFNEYHALIVKLGKECCRPKPQCACCPLARFPRTT